MGLTISSKRYSADMGYDGFNAFRRRIAQELGASFFEHYSLLSLPATKALIGEQKDSYLKDYNYKTKQFIIKGVVSYGVADFLYQSENMGKIDSTQAKEIFKIIQYLDDEISFGYYGKKNWARMSDMKNIFNDKTRVKWY